MQNIAFPIAQPIAKAIANVLGTISGGLPSPVLFSAPLQSTLVATGVGDTTPTYTRAVAGTATVVDYTGTVRSVLDGEARFQGARRVENLVLIVREAGSATGVPSHGDTSLEGTITNLAAGSSGALTLAALTTIPAEFRTFVASLDIKAAVPEDVGKTITLQMTRESGGTGGQNTKEVTLTSEYQRVESADRTYLAGNLGPKLNCYQGTTNPATQFTSRNHQLEEVTWETDKTPSEYVSRAAGDTHGANADGVKYFTTAKDGSPIDASDYYADADGPYGYLSESASTNICLDSGDVGFVAPWIISVSRTNDAATAPDGTTEATRISPTNDTSGHQVAQGIAGLVSGTVYTWSVYAKAEVANFIQLNAYGSFNGGWVNFDLNTDGVSANGAGVTGAITSIGNGWKRISMTCTCGTTGASGVTMQLAQSLADGRAPSYAGNSANTLLVWGAQLEASSFPTSYIPTVASSESRSPDTLTYPDAGNIDNTEGTLSLDVAVNWSTSTGNYIVSRGNNGRMSYTSSGEAATRSRAFDGTNLTTVFSAPTMYDTVQPITTSWGPTGLRCTQGGTVGSLASYDGSWSDDDLEIGHRPFNAVRTDGTIRNVVITNKETV